MRGGEVGRRATAAAPRGLLFRPLLSHLQLPRPRVDVVARRELVAGLLRSTAPLVVVSAAAGSGKTLTLMQWVQTDPRPNAWLQLDKTDNDPVVLLTYLALALEGVTTVDPGVFDHLTAPVAPIHSRILPSLEASLSAAAPFLLVLDDAQLVRTKTCWEVLCFLIDHLPAGAQLALATREDPPLPLGKMRASGLISEFRAPELALTRGEARELLGLHGRPADDATLDALLEVTEGWVAGVYLALLAGEGRAAAQWLPQIRGDEREIADYLVGEVLERQPHRAQEFLLKTSILERLSAPLCHAVTGRHDAGTTLRRLARENLFVVALDEREEWYRYHHLFAELLRTELRRRLPDEVAGLHRAAAVWSDAHDDSEQAVRHWLAAGDIGPAADTTASLCVGLLDCGRAETARRLVAMFSDQQILGHAQLLLAAGWVLGVGHPHYVNDRAREHLVRAACRAPMDDAASFDQAASLRSSQAQLRAFIAPDGVRRMLADAELSLELESQSPESGWYAEACKLRGIALYLAGQPAKATGPLKAQEDPADGNDAGTASEALAFQSLIAADGGRWEDAEALAGRAWRYAGRAGEEWEYPLAVLLAQARVLVRHDDPGSAEILARAARFLDEMPNVWDREAVLGAVVLGEIALGRGELVEAERWSDRAQAVLRTYPDAGMLGPRAERLRLALQERRLGLVVTAAEQRVLELLPTELSVEGIGGRLFISKNTMRSHLRSLYAKLGVHSRAAAVERARELGLLKPGR